MPKVSMSAVAEAAGASRQTLYKHDGDLEAHDGVPTFCCNFPGPVSRTPLATGSSLGVMRKACLARRHWSRDAPRFLAFRSVAGGEP